MKKIGLIGYGELARQVEKFILQQIKTKMVFYFFDDILYKKKIKNSFPFEHHVKEKFSEIDFYICLGYKLLPKKDKIIKKLLGMHRNLPNLIHKTAYISPDAEIGKGTVIYPLSNIDKNSFIGNGVIINNSVAVSHDNKIGNCCYVSPGVVTSGFVDIGNRCFIGSGVVVSNYCRISDDCIIGVGSVITRNIPPKKSVIGNPLRILKKRINLI